MIILEGAGVLASAWALGMARGWLSTRQAGDRLNWRVLAGPVVYGRWAGAQRRLRRAEEARATVRRLVRKHYGVDLLDVLERERAS